MDFEKEEIELIHCQLIISEVINGHIKFDRTSLRLTSNLQKLDLVKGLPKTSFMKIG